MAPSMPNIPIEVSAPTSPGMNTHSQSHSHSPSHSHSHSHSRSPSSSYSLSSSPEDERRRGRGLGLAGIPSSRNSSVTRDPSSMLHPEDSNTPPRYGTGSSHVSRGSSSLANETVMTPYDPHDSSTITEENDSGNAGPFQFKSRTYTPLTSAASPRSPHKSVVSQVMGQRRGHRYKHSSVSHQFFLEPTPRAPLRLPASLPIPTTKEGWASMTRDQTARMTWCFCHLFVAAYVQWTAQGSLALTALSHLIFYDAIGAFLCAGVEVLSNFEVWKRSSIRHPFGLERSEVLVGFAMSILLLFMGFDLISHNASHILESSDDSHEPHRSHEHAGERVEAGSLNFAILLAIASTLISALFLQNHARMARSMRLGRSDFLPPLLNNPSHLLTLSCSTVLLAMPLLSLDLYNALDGALSTVMALAMCALGTALVRTLGAMLLMSYAPRPTPDASSTNPTHHAPSKAQPTATTTTGSVHTVVAALETDPNVAHVLEAKFWQVHYGLCLANVVLRVRGTEDALARLRERVQSLVRTRLGGGYGSGAGAAWEVSIEMVADGAGAKST